MCSPGVKVSEEKHPPQYENITCTLKECSSLHCVSSIPKGKPLPANILVTPQNLSRCCAENRHWIISPWINQTEVCFAWQQQRCLTFTEGATERAQASSPSASDTHKGFVWGTNMLCYHCCHSFQYQGGFFCSLCVHMHCKKSADISAVSFFSKPLTFEIHTRRSAQNGLLRHSRG